MIDFIILICLFLSLSIFLAFLYVLRKFAKLHLIFFYSLLILFISFIFNSVFISNINLGRIVEVGVVALFEDMIRVFLSLLIIYNWKEDVDKAAMCVTFAIVLGALYGFSENMLFLYAPFVALIVQWSGGAIDFDNSVLSARLLKLDLLGSLFLLGSVFIRPFIHTLLIFILLKFIFSRSWVGLLFISSSHVVANMILYTNYKSGDIDLYVQTLFLTGASMLFVYVFFINIKELYMKINSNKIKRSF